MPTYVVRYTRMVVVVIILGMCLTAPARAQGHFTTCADGTDTADNAILVVPVDSAPSVDGASLPSGSQIAVFSAERSDFCAGVTTWEGSNTSLTIWGEDPDTGGEGLRPGEGLAFRVWDASTGQEHGASSVSVSYAPGPGQSTTGVYQHDAFYVLASLSVTIAPAAPAMPVLSNPADGTAGIALPVLLSWQASSGAETYRVQVATDGGFGTVVIDEGGLAGTTYEASSLDYATAYHWRVQAANGGGTSAWSAAQSFTTAAGPSSVLVAPEHGATGLPTTVTFQWNSIQGGRHYDLQIATVSDFSFLAAEYKVRSGLSQTVQGLTPGTTYYWRVLARGRRGFRATSEVRRFTTAATGARAEAATLEEATQEQLMPVRLYANYPNPFNPETTISFNVSDPVHVTVQVYDVLGQEVATLMSQVLPAGTHAVQWSAAGLPSGLYLCRITAGSFTQQQAMLLMK